MGDAMTQDEALRVAYQVELSGRRAAAREIADRFFPGVTRMADTTTNSNAAAKEVVVQGAIKAICDAVSSGISLGRQGREDLGRAIERDTMNSSAGRAIGAPRQHGSFVRVQPYG